MVDRYHRRSNEESVYYATLDDADALNTAIEALKSCNWIPCTERLPEEDGRYWISTKSLTCEDYFKDGEFEFFRSNVRAWMPLPDPWEKCRGEKQ